MYKSITQYIQFCDTCQKQGQSRANKFLHLISVGKPFDWVGIDIVGPLKVTSNNNRYIIVATEYLTKWPEAKAIPDMKATTVAKFIYDEIISWYGYPKELLSD